LQKLIEGALGEILDDRDFVKLYGSGSFESQRSWWLVDDKDCEDPLSDRIELKFLELFRQTESWSVPNLETKLCATFPGFLTPGHILFQALLDSYTTADPTRPGFVKLRPEDNDDSRNADLLEAKKKLQKVGGLLGVTTEGENPVFWLKAGNKKEYAFYLTTQSIIVPFLRELTRSPVKNGIVVFPGGRAGLLEEKLHRNLHLAEAAGQLHFLKFRHLKELSTFTKLTQDKWTDQLGKDQLQWSSPRQISMLESMPDSDLYT
jgi:hypothetical protein